MKIEKTPYEPLDTGVYPATVAEVEPVEGKYGPQLRILLELEDGTNLTAWCSTTYSDRSKLGKWARAILGEAPEVLDTDALIGKPCRISVTLKTRDDGSEYNRVDEILAPRAGQRPRLRPEPETEEIPF